MKANEAEFKKQCQAVKVGLLKKVKERRNGNGSTPSQK